MRSSRLPLVIACAALIAPAVSAPAADLALKEAEPATISHGNRVRISDYLVLGKTTIFDFSSECSPTCRAMARGLLKLHETRDDVAVVFVDIDRPGARSIDWNSPVSLQYNMATTPGFMVYGPDGKLRAEGRPAFALVAGWLGNLQPR